ncbi:MAG: DUF47 domain-containing protein [Chlamydiales bacterium]
MFGKFLPRTATFFDDFDRHASLVSLSAQQLLEMISTGENFAEHAGRMEGFEKEADLVLHHCIQSLHKTFITPFERDDIYKLISQLNDIVDYIEEVAARIVLYRLTSMPELFKEMASLLASASQDVHLLVQALRKLDQIDEMRQQLARIRAYENESDIILRRALAELFVEEKDPVNLIKWKELYEFMESAVDYCEDVANTVEGIIIEQ